MSEKVERYRRATSMIDIETLGELRHPDYTCTYPQSGERFAGHDKWAAAHRNYADRFGDQNLDDATVKGGEQKTRVATTPTGNLPFMSAPIIQVSDTGDLVVLEGRGHWPNGKTYNYVMILEYRDGLVWRETQYFAEPFAAPAWRAEFTEATD